jgi:hypothetical protein
MLALEAFAVFFAGLVAKDLSGLGTGRALALFSGLALACLLTTGALRSSVGYLIGSLLQVAVLALGFWVPAMFVVGAIFAALWVVALRVGSRIERERAAFVARHPETDPN